MRRSPSSSRSSSRATSCSGPQAAAAPRTDAAIAKAVFTGGLQVGYLLTLSIGVLTIGSEYRHQTITATFLAIPRRGRVMAAKVVSLLAIGVLYGLLSLAGAVGAGTLVLTSKGIAPFADTSIWRTLALSLLVLGLWALIGLGAGILIPNQVAALLISVAVAWIVEPVLGLVLALTDWGKSISPYLPSRATSAMLESSSGGFNGQPVDQLSWWARRARAHGVCRRDGRSRDVADAALRHHLTRRSGRP